MMAQRQCCSAQSIHLALGIKKRPCGVQGSYPQHRFLSDGFSVLSAQIRPFSEFLVSHFLTYREYPSIPRCLKLSSSEAYYHTTCCWGTLLSSPIKNNVQDRWRRNRLLYPPRAMAKNKATLSEETQFFLSSFWRTSYSEQYLHWYIQSTIQCHCAGLWQSQHTHASYPDTLKEREGKAKNTKRNETKISKKWNELKK